MKAKQNVASRKTSKIEMSIVIPTLGKSPHLRGLLERLQRQSADFTFRVFVVANIPSQALRKLVNSMGDRRSEHQKQFEYLETGRLGVNLARNKGLERAQGNVVLFLDDDIILESDTFVADHFALHISHPEALAIGGPYQLTSTHSKWDKAYHEVSHRWLARSRTSQHRTMQLLGGNVSFKIAMLAELGLTFDEQITFGGAETSLFQRASLAGHSLLYFDALAVGHAPGLSRFSFRRKAFLQGAGARLRDEALAALPLQYTNQSAPSSEDPASRLFARYFQFGWTSAPYGIAFRKSDRTIQPSLGVFSFAIFMLRKAHPLRALRIGHRRMYAAFRTAWINGRAGRSSLKLQDRAR